jgi:SAM-dependent methyltransferase
MSNEHPIQWDQANVSRLWDYYSRHRPFSDAYFAKVYGKAILRHSRLPPARELDVLDFGCGPGFVWGHLLSFGARWNYTGLDFSRASVDAAARAGKGHRQFKGVQCIERLPVDLPSEQFDAVFLLEVVEHLADDALDASLREVHRLLKRGGALIITTPNNEDLAQATKYCPDCGAVFHEWQHVRSWTAEGLAARAEQHGFDSTFLRPVDFAATDLARTMFRRARRLVKGEGMPHLIARFHKP